MRTGKIVFISSVAALAALTVPALANNSAQKTTEQPTSSPYQQAPDGSWTQLPCQELGSGNQPQHKSATRSSDEETR